MNLLIVILIVYIFYNIRRFLWFVTADGHVGVMAHPFRLFKYNFIRYFKFVEMPLSKYLVSITFGMKKEIGVIIYDFIVTVTGIIVYFVVLIAFKEESIAIVTMILFYFCLLLPGAYDTNVVPEAYANFMSILGLLIVIVSIEKSWNCGIVVGTIITALGFWCKISTTESLWVIVYVYLKKGFDKEIYLVVFTLIFMAILYVILVLIEKKYINKNKKIKGCNETTIDGFRNLLKWILLEYSLLSKNGSLLKDNIKIVTNQLSIIFPVVILFIIGINSKNIGSQNIKLIFVWILISFIPVILRMHIYRPIRYLMAHLPLSIAASYGIIALWPFIKSNSLSSSIIIILILILIISNYIRVSWWKDRGGNYKREKIVIDYLRNRVSTEDYIFQDNASPQIYYELKCNGPESTFILAAHFIKFELEKQNKSKEFIHYFIENKPKYFISLYKGNDAAYGKKVTLSEIERLSGLRYRLEEYLPEAFAYIYKLDRVTEPEKVDEIELELLCSGDFERYEKDRRELQLSRQFKMAKESLDKIEIIGKTIIYAASELSYRICDYIQNKKNSEIIGFVDKDFNKIGLAYNGSNIYSSDTLKEIDFENIIIASYNNQKSIFNYLVQSNLNKKIIKIFN